MSSWGADRACLNNFECEPPASVDSTYPYPLRAERALEGHGRLLWITLSRASDCAKYGMKLNAALHSGPEGHSCAEKLNTNNDQVGRETLQLFKLSLRAAGVSEILYRDIACGG